MNDYTLFADKPKNITPRLEICPLDFIPYNMHLRCDRCTIYIGKSHYMQHPVSLNGKTYCTHCAPKIEEVSK